MTRTNTAASTLPFYDNPARACRDHPRPGIFYPDSGARDAANEAKAVCRGCPVRDECLAWALDTGECCGIWGGKTPVERKHILRDRQGRRT